MIVMSSDFVLTLTEATANTPIIGYHNLLSTTNIVASAEASGYPASNLANPLTYSEWKGTSVSAAVTLTFTNSGYTDNINYLGIAEHNLGTTGSSILVEGNTGSGYTTIASLNPGDDTPIMFLFVGAVYTSIRVTIDPSGAEVPRIAVMYIGTKMEIERNIYVGHSPLAFSRKDNVVGGRSENGKYTGRIILSSGISGSIALQNLTAAWYRNNFEYGTFKDTARTEPFFFAWRPGTYPLEVAYCWTTDNPVPSNTGVNGMMAVTIGVEGIA